MYAIGVYIVYGMNLENAPGKASKERRGLGKDINSKKSGKCIRLPRGIHNSSGTVINSSDPLVNTNA